MSLYLVLLQTGFTMPSSVTTDAVRSYHTLSPLPATHNIAVAGCLGGLLSAALSVGSRPPGITWRLVLWSPDFPPLTYCGGVNRTDISSDSLANSGADGTPEADQATGLPLLFLD